MIRTSFNDAWFVRRDGPEATTGPVVLPYDAMLREQRDPDAPAGMNTGFYPATSTAAPRRSTRRSSAVTARQSVLELEGVFHRSEVFVNGAGELLGSRW